MTKTQEVILKQDEAFQLLLWRQPHNELSDGDGGTRFIVLSSKFLAFG